TGTPGYARASAAGGTIAAIGGGSPTGPPGPVGPPGSAGPPGPGPDPPPAPEPPAPDPLSASSPGRSGRPKPKGGSLIAVVSQAGWNYHIRQAIPGALRGERPSSQGSPRAERCGKPQEQPARHGPGPDSQARAGRRGFAR